MCILDKVTPTKVQGCSACVENVLYFICSDLTSTSDASKGIVTVLLLPYCLDLRWCRGVCGDGTLSREGLPGFGSTSLQRPEIPGSDQPGFQSDLNNMHIDEFGLFHSNMTIRFVIWQSLFISEDGFQI